MLRRADALAAAWLVVVAGAALAGAADGRVVCDDAFYYFQIARNAALGHGFTFDGIAPTNGFHPLWAWLCVIVWRVAGTHPWLPVRIALALLALASAATASVLARVGRELGDERAGVLMAALYLTSPFTVILTLRGCEGPLSSLALALALLALVRLGRAPTVARAAWLGLAVGAAGLARTENVLFAAAALGFVAWRTRSWRALAVCSAVAAVTVAPWIAWSELRLGTWIQVSGAAKRAIDLHGRMPPVTGPLAAAGNLGRALVAAAGYVAGEEFQLKRWTGALLAAGALFVVIPAYIAKKRPIPRELYPILIFGALHLMIYSWYFRAYYNWYFLPIALVAAVFAGERAAGWRWRRFLVAASAIECILVVAIFCVRTPLARYGAEREIEPILNEIASLPEGTRVGILNAGAIGYFAGYRAPGVHVVNLDCVVDNVAFAAWRRGEYGQWLAANVDWVDGAPDARFVADPAGFAAAHARVVPGMALLRISR